MRLTGFKDGIRILLIVMNLSYVKVCIAFI